MRSGVCVQWEYLEQCFYVVLQGLPGLDKTASGARGILTAQSPMSPESFKLLHRHRSDTHILHTVISPADLWPFPHFSFSCLHTSHIFLMLSLSLPPSLLPADSRCFTSCVFWLFGWILHVLFFLRFLLLPVPWPFWLQFATPPPPLSPLASPVRRGPSAACWSWRTEWWWRTPRTSTACRSD